MRAREFMTRPAITLPATASVKDAARSLLRHRISGAPVVDDDGRVVGIATELDLLLGEVPVDPVAHLAPVEEETTAPSRFVSEVMTTDVVGLPEDADAAAFAELMRKTGFKSIPVLSGDHVVGIVSRRDLLRAVARDDAAIRADVLTRLQEYGGALDECEVQVEDGIVRLAPGAVDELTAQTAVILARGVPGAIRAELVSPSLPA